MESRAQESDIVRLTDIEPDIVKTSRESGAFHNAFRPTLDLGVDFVRIVLHSQK